MKPLSLLRIFMTASLIALFLSYLGIWVRFINDPVQRTGSDFMAFYSAGRVAQEKGTAHVYDLSLQKEIQENQVGFSLLDEQILPFIHPPFLIPVLQIVIQTDYVFSFYLWVTMMAVFYVMSITIFNHYLNQNGFDMSLLLPLAAGALMFLPLFFSLMNGQDTAILLLGAAIWVYGLFTNKQHLAGIGLSLTTIRPHLALILGVAMLFGHPKVFFGFALGSGLLALLSFFILSMEGVKEFINVIQLSASGVGFGTKESAMFNLIGFLSRTMPWLDRDIVHSLGWMVYGLTLIGLCFLWGRKKDSQNGRVGLTVILALFAAPHLHFHDLTLLLVPIYELAGLIKAKGSLNMAIVTVTPLAVSLLFLISNISPSLQFTVPYLVMLALATYPYYLRSKMPATTPHQS